ncbi:hypothetical protein [Microvirga lotononidis]|uniref:Yip1 domain-containing protein n=1 Tax=Microvirga lotononidis TaxID=864069 RepID=I4YUP1_9HYPH|nr:hypothetical protein [Microvirga lotononidis]EIM27683.1 hypothetical protein MicloDRAFT_00042550 [Microvirga lotononidis]WQO28179.1 hypothetical protein U0023_03485 [Microvirga lotononidis]
MIVTAEEVNRSFRGTLDLLNSRSEGLKSFDMSERGFWRSFTAIWLTLPAYVVSLAFERLRLGLLQPDRPLLDSFWIDLVVALGHVAGFVALPVAMIWIARWLRLEKSYVPFVIVTNWISVMGMLVLSVPAMLMLLGWAPAGLASLFSLAFAIIIVRLQWFATKETLKIESLPALGIVILGIMLNSVIGTAMRGLLG